MNNKGIYHSGKTAQAVDCKLVLHEGSLYLYLQDETKSLVIWSFQSFASCQYSGSTLIIKKSSFPPDTLECTGDMARSIYTLWSTKSFVKKEEGVSLKKKGLIAFILSLPFLLLFLLVCGVGYFFILPWAAEKSTVLVPVNVEIQMGQQLGQVYAQQETLNDSAAYYANCFIQHLALDTIYPLRVQVIQSPEINALALPGGNIVVYTGILQKMNSYEELAALLGHEATHVTHRHSLKSIFRSAASGLLISTLFGDLSGMSAAVISQADRFKQLDYSRELETEADNNGLNLVVRNKISGRGMLNLLKLLKAGGAEMPGMMKYLSTHPDTDARIKNIGAQAATGLIFPENKALESCFNGIRRSLNK